MNVAKGLPKTVVSDSTGIDPVHEQVVLRYLLTNEQVQKAITDAKAGNEGSSRSTLMKTIYDMVTEIYKNRAKATAEPGVVTFEQLVEYYMSIQSKVGRKNALKEFNTRLSSFESLPTPEAAARQIINLGLNSTDAVRPCAELLADLISVGHIASRVLAEAMPAVVSSLDDISAHNPAAPDIFVIAVSEIALHAPPDRVSNELLTNLLMALGNTGLLRLAKVATGRGKQVAVQHLARVRGMSVADVEKQLAN